MKAYFVLALAVPLGILSACAIDSTPVPPPASAITEPLRATNIDEQGVRLAYDAYDAVLTSVDRLIDVGAITPGSARALQLRELLYRVQQALNAASSAQRAGNAENYRAALADAKVAYVSIKNLVQGAPQ